MLTEGTYDVIGEYATHFTPTSKYMYGYTYFTLKYMYLPLCLRALTRIYHCAGEWNVVKLDSQGEESARGVLPNLARAETLRRPKDDREKTGRGSIFRRKSQKRSKSLGRDHWEDVIFGELSISNVQIWW